MRVSIDVSVLPEHRENNIRQLNVEFDWNIADLHFWNNFWQRMEFVHIKAWRSGVGLMYTGEVSVSPAICKLCRREWRRRSPFGMRNSGFRRRFIRRGHPTRSPGTRSITRNDGLRAHHVWAMFMMQESMVDGYFHMLQTHRMEGDVLQEFLVWARMWFGHFVDMVNTTAAELRLVERLHADIPTQVDRFGVHRLTVTGVTPHWQTSPESTIASDAEPSTPTVPAVD